MIRFTQRDGQSTTGVRAPRSRKKAIRKRKSQARQQQYQLLGLPIAFAIRWASFSAAGAEPGADARALDVDRSRIDPAGLLDVTPRPELAEVLGEAGGEAGGRGGEDDVLLRVQESAVQLVEPVQTVSASRITYL